LTLVNPGQPKKKTHEKGVKILNFYAKRETKMPRRVVFPNTLSKPMKPIDPRNSWFVGFVLKKQLSQLGTENREREIEREREWDSC
jgi:hypothetical protein